MSPQRTTHKELSTNKATIWTKSTIQPDAPPPIVVMAEIHRTMWRFVDERDVTKLLAIAKHLHADLTVDDVGESLGVVHPSSNDRFQYTLKEAARPVSGTITVDGSAHEISPDNSFAFHNRGRSNEPKAGVTRWATGSGRVDGEKVDATLTPFHKRHSSHKVGLATSDTHEVFGTWSGHAFDDSGARHSLDGLTGWAEQSKNPW